MSGHAKHEEGSRHVFTSSVGERTFEWVRGKWNTPGTGYGTKPSAMSVLGWRYVRPETTEKTP